MAPDNEKRCLRVGIIGVGNIGSAHATAILSGKVEGMRLAALCDKDGAHLSRIAERYRGIPRFLSAQELIASGLCDTVIVSTPHYDHPVIAELAFDAGLNVLTEKPAGVYCEAVRRMSEAARRSGKAFGVMFNQRTNALFREAKRIVSSGELGKLVRCVWIITNWYRKQCYYDSGSWRASWRGEGGGVLLNQAPHNLDLLQWICGMPSHVYARCEVGKYHDIEVEDDATLLLRYESGMTAVFITSTGEYPGTNRLEITGTRGKLVIENGKLTHTRAQMDEREFRHTEESAQNVLTVSELTDEPKNGHIQILQNYARHILTGEELIASGYEAIGELTLSNAAYLSAWTGREIALPMDDALFTRELFRRVDEGGAVRKTDTRADVHFSYKTRWNTNWENTTFKKM